MTNQFHLRADSWATRIVELVMFAFLGTNTWHFIGSFIPADTWYHQPSVFLFFEGGLLYWFNRFEHASENIGKTIIAAFMTLVQLAAVGFATFYELSVGFQQLMGVHMDTTVQFAMPFLVTGLIMLWIIAWALGRLMNPHFGARMSYLAKNGVSPHTVIDPDRGYVTGTLSPSNQLPGQRTQAALPAPKQGTIQQAQPTGRRNKLGNLFARWGSFLQNGGTTYTAAPIDDPAGASDEQEDLRDGTAPDADAEPVSVVSGMQPEVQYNIVPRPAQPRAHTRSNSAPQRKRRSSAQIDKILSALDAQTPGLSDTELARSAGVSRTTVSTWRKS